MKSTLLMMSLMLAGVSAAQTPPVPTPIDSVHLTKAVTLLYEQTEDGGQRMLCTATAYRVMPAVVTKQDGSEVAAGDQLHRYRFASAAHCVSGDDDVEIKGSKYFITSDSAGEKTFIPAKLIESGDKQTGDDFSIFEATTTQIFEIVPLGNEKLDAVGDRVINVASPLGLGRQYFEGYISSLTLDRPKFNGGEVSWHDAYLVAIGGGPGSSGSAIVSVKQGAIVGFLVGQFERGQVGFIIIPVSQFKTFEAKVDAKTYKKTPKRFPLFGLFDR